MLHLLFMLGVWVETTLPSLPDNGGEYLVVLTKDSYQCMTSHVRTIS